MIRAMIFDFYDTLFMSGDKMFFDQNGIDYNDPKITAVNDLLDSGQISREEYYKQLSKIIGKVVELSGMSDAERVNHPLLEYIRHELLGKYKLAILSNAGHETAVTKHLSAEQLAMFDYVGVSAQTGFLKPDRRAYGDAAEHLGIDTNQCVFVDDRVTYCAAAEKAGMKAVLYKDIGSLIAELEGILRAKNTKI